MKRGFSALNIIIIIGVLSLAYLGYAKYIKIQKDQLSLPITITQKNIPSGDKNDTLVNTSSDISTQKQSITQKPEINNTQDGKSESSLSPSLSTSPSQSETYQQDAPSKPTEPAKPTTDNGYYENSTYHYSITCPPDWPLRVRSEDNISIGTVPPKNGQGAITIKVVKGTISEINQIKAEIKKYPGLMSLTEETITLANVDGNKIIITNFVASTKDIYIILKKYNYDYLIKYSEESPEFVSQVNVALQTFKFTK